MTLQDMGSIGEFVGAVATLGTLLYLAIQIRANTTALRTEARREHFATGRENNQMIITNRDVSELMQGGLIDPDSLDPVDGARFSFLMASFVNNAELAFVERDTGVIEHEEAERAMKATARFMRAPGGARFWSTHGRNYHASFREAMDDLIAGKPLSRLK